jgi:spore coat polysaccharide biosynthesis protein SpsF
MLDHVIDACKCSADYTNKFTHRTNIGVTVCLLVPAGDPIQAAYSHRLPVLTGPEHDVLKRYYDAAVQMDADFICRVTSDCPLLPPYIVSKAIKLAYMNCYDYVGNVDPRFRTALDGQDVEVMSRKMLTWAHDTATEKQDREHVTTICRSNPPDWARIGTIIGFFDQSDLKLSVDTPEDLVAVRRQFAAVQEKVRRAERLLGRDSVHRF